MNDSSSHDSNPQAAASGERTVERVTLTEQPTLTIRFQAPSAQLSAKLAEVLPAVFVHAQKSGAQMVGPPFSRYHAMTEDTVDVEAGLPVAAAASGDDAAKIRA
ncbi:MAG: hypothetical protein AAGC55_31575, partial [Myxococcota bacterium]